MAHTWKHQWRYHYKEYWRKRRYGFEEPKDRSFNPPPYFENMWQVGTRKRWAKKMLWKKHRHAWKQALHEMDFEKIERLSRRPERYAWII